ncbi:MAG: outer membrane protein assembly factor BamD [Pseudomonadota bacterium]
MKIKLSAISYQLSAIIILLIIILSNTSCVKKVPDESKTDAELFSEATILFEKKDFDDALMKFKILKTKYPASKYLTETELKIAICYYEKSEWIEAIAAFQNFEKLHPTNEHVALAIYKTGLSYYNDSPKAIDRDQTSLKKALEQLKRLKERYPSFEYMDNTKEVIAEIHKRLGDRIIYIGNFYFKRDNWQAALNRYKEAISNYEDLSFQEELYYKIGICYKKLGETDASEQVLKLYLNKYPDGKYYKKIKNILKL